jgi:hypothetical protein
LREPLTSSQLSRHETIPNPCTHNHIMRLIGITVETELFTGGLGYYIMSMSIGIQDPPAAMSITNLVIYLCRRDQIYFTVTVALIAKLYSNTMLLILNNHMSIVGGRNEVESHFSIHVGFDIATPGWGVRHQGSKWEEPTPIRSVAPLYLVRSGWMGRTRITQKR